MSLLGNLITQVQTPGATLGQTPEVTWNCVPAILRSDIKNNNKYV